MGHRERTRPARRGEHSGPAFAQGEEHATGISPGYDDLNWTGLDFNAAQWVTVASIDNAAWLKELELHAELFKQLSYHLPKELGATKIEIERRLAA